MTEIKTTVNEYEQLQNQVALRLDRIRKRVDGYIAKIEQEIDDKKRPSLPAKRES